MILYLAIWSLFIVSLQPKGLCLAQAYGNERTQTTSEPGSKDQTEGFDWLLTGFTAKPLHRDWSTSDGIGNGKNPPNYNVWNEIKFPDPKEFDSVKNVFAQIDQDDKEHRKLMDIIKDSNLNELPKDIIMNNEDYSSKKNQFSQVLRVAARIVKLILAVVVIVLSVKMVIVACRKRKIAAAMKRNTSGDTAPLTTI